MIASLLLSLFACTAPETGDTGTGVTPREFSDCDPIAYDYCALPYPSSFYLRDDPDTVTGVRVHLGATTIPQTYQGYQPPPDLWNELDGFSPMGPLLARFPNLALTNIPSHDDIAASIADGAPIVILDMETGERVPYFAELDAAGQRVPGKEFLFIRPVVPMENGHRYAVGIRNLTDTSGSAIAPSEGFAALRDGTATTNWDIEGRRDTYEEIFTTLEQDGWSRSETVLAWDFVVASKEKITGRAVWMRDDAMARMGATGPSYVIDTVTDNVSETIYREIEGRMTVPLYLEADDTNTLLTRDEDGMPYYNGDTEVPFTIRVPWTAVNDPRPLKLVQYGHGLLGDRGEMGSGYLGEMAERYGYVLFAVNWRGMDEDDQDAITLMLVTDIGRFGIIPEGGHQGLVQFVAAAAMMQGTMASDPNLAFTTEAGETVSVVDPSEVLYYGNSQGGILGGVYLALSPTIERGVLGVPGMPYSLLLSRSADFTPFFALFQGIYHNQEDISFWMALLQNLWDSAEPGGWGRQMTIDPVDGVPVKQVLVQDAIGDAQVTTIGAQNMARAYGAALVDPPVAEIWGLETQTSGFTGSALVEYEHGAPEVPFENLPPDSEYDTHEETRRTFAAQEQLNTFLTTGVIEHFCDGTCDPE